MNAYLQKQAVSRVGPCFNRWRPSRPLFDPSVPPRSARVNLVLPRRPRSGPGLALTAACTAHLASCRLGPQRCLAVKDQPLSPLWTALRVVPTPSFLGGRAWLGLRGLCTWPLPSPPPPLLVDVDPESVPKAHPPLSISGVAPPSTLALMSRSTVAVGGKAGQTGCTDEQVHGPGDGSGLRVRLPVSWERRQAPGLLAATGPHGPGPTGGLQSGATRVPPCAPLSEILPALSRGSGPHPRSTAQARALWVRAAA